MHNIQLWKEQRAKPTKNIYVQWMIQPENENKDDWAQYGSLKKVIMKYYGKKWAKGNIWTTENPIACSFQ